MSKECLCFWGLYLLVTILVATPERVERAWFLAFIEYHFKFLLTPLFFVVPILLKESDFLSLHNFKIAMSSMQRQPKMEYLEGIKVFFHSCTFLACQLSLILIYFFVFSFTCLLFSSIWNIWTKIMCTNHIFYYLVDN